MNGHRRNKERNGETRGGNIDIHLGEIITGKDDPKHHTPYLQNNTIFGNEIFHIFCPWISERLPLTLQAYKTTIFASELINLQK